jgi:cobalt-zinc-cadmium efflux system outer membrane protein
VPVFNRNQGNITSAHAELIKARQDYADTTNRLMSQLAESFNRYETSRVISESYRKDLVPDQVRVYRGVYDRFLIDGQSVDFAQVVISQQTLGQVVSSYVASLQSEWLATVDLAETLQVDDLMTMDGSANSEGTTTSSVSPAGLPVPAVMAQDATGTAKIVAPYEQTIP